MASERAQRQRMDEFYTAGLRRHGADPDDARCLGWASRASQRARFAVLVRIADLEGKQLLDAGCGFGDLYGFLAERLNRFHYVGADALPEMVETARRKWHHGLETAPARFDLGEPSDLYPPRSFDYVLASGFLSIGDERDPAAHLRDGVASLFALCREGLSFNLLDRRVVPPTGDIVSFLPEEALAACSLVSADAELVTGYLDIDFTIHARRRPTDA